MKKLIFIYIMLIASCSVLESRANGVYVGGWSKHVNQKAWERAGYKINQQQNMIAVEFGGNIAGKYTNTFGKETFLAAHRFDLFALDDIKLSVLAGATYGYTFCNTPDKMATGKKLCPAVTPELRYTRYKIQPAIIAIHEGVALLVRVELD